MIDELVIIIRGWFAFSCTCVFVLALLLARRAVQPER